MPNAGSSILGCVGRLWGVYKLCLACRNAYFFSLNDRSENDKAVKVRKLEVGSWKLEVGSWKYSELWSKCLQTPVVGITLQSTKCYQKRRLLPRLVVKYHASFQDVNFLSSEKYGQQHVTHPLQI